MVTSETHHEPKYLRVFSMPLQQNYLQTITYHNNTGKDFIIIQNWRNSCKNSEFSKSCVWYPKREQFKV